MPRDIHPIHARGVRSPTLASAHVEARLTDADIERYMREGRYGLRAKHQIELLDAKRAKPKKPKKQNPLSLALATLKNLL